MLGSMRVGRGDCSVYASCYAYSQRKAMGTAWDEWIAGELERLDKTGKSSIPGLHCCYGATLLDGEVVHLAVEANGLLARSRSRQAGLACTSGADVWLTCDDDVYAPADVVADLIHAARATRGMVAAPYWLRQAEPRTAFRYRGEPRMLSVDGVELCTADALHTGFGLVAMHVDVLRAVGRVVARRDGRTLPGRVSRVRRRRGALDRRGFRVLPARARGGATPAFAAGRARRARQPRMQADRARRRALHGAVRRRASGGATCRAMRSSR